MQSVLSAANHLQILPVVQACSDFLFRQLDIDNCVDIITIAETYSMSQLCKAAYVFTARHLERLSCMVEFSRLSQQQLEKLLSGQYPVECREVDVLHSALCWLQYQAVITGSSAVQLLTHVRLGDIPQEDLEGVMTSALFASVESRCPAIRTYINGAHYVETQLNNLVTSARLGVVNSRGLDAAIVTVGGFHPDGVTNEVTYLPRDQSTWYKLTDIPHVEQSSFGMTVLNNELYVVGGCFQHSLQESTHPFGFRYNPLTDCWKSIAPMRRDRSDFYLAAVSGRLYVIGGVQHSRSLDEDMPCESYNPELDQWSDIANMSRCLEQYAGSCYGNQIFISGGLDLDDVVPSLLSYNVTSDEWETLPDLLHPRVDHCMTSHEGKLYVAGGWTFDTVLRDRRLIPSIDSYDISTQQWQTVTQVFSPRYFASLVILDNKLHFMGGFEQNSLRDVNRGTNKIERYDLSTGRWLEDLEYPQQIWEHLSCVIYLPTCRDDSPLEPTLDSHCWPLTWATTL